MPLVQVKLIEGVQGLRTTFPGPTHHNGRSGIDGDFCFLVKPKLLD